MTDKSYPLMEMPGSVGAEQPATARFMANKYANFQRELSFPDSSDLKIWDVWRQELRDKLAEILCLEAWGDVPTPTIQIMEQESCDKVTVA